MKTIIKVLVILFLGIVTITGCKSTHRAKKGVNLMKLSIPENNVRIKPDISAEKLSEDVKEYYEYWKNAHVKESNGNTPGGGFYVSMQGTGGDGSEKTTSEAHGYGMIIFALMQDKEYFDGMYNMFDKHRSSHNEYLMSWVIDKTEKPEKHSSATDGDFDIAYALLLAHELWGSDGNIDYIGEALDIINLGIKRSELNVFTSRIMMGDWDSNPFSTRSSDWMTGHLRAFNLVTADDTWNKAVDEVYTMVESITAQYSPRTGLMPDFVVEEDVKPAPAKFMESVHDGAYYYNACRFPWRMAADYLHNGSYEAKKACYRLAYWLTSTYKDPYDVHSGFSLDGKPIGNYQDMSFIAPLLTACTVDERYRDFLTEGWQIMTTSFNTYYPDTITLLCMLLISDIWWAPGTGINDFPVAVPPEPTPVIEGPNLALKAAVASSSIESDTLSGNFAADGKIGTRWASAETDDEWLLLDLGANKDINRIILYWETAYGKDYNIEVSMDNNIWSPIYSENNSDGFIDDIMIETSARFVKIKGNKRATEWGYSLYEVEVYGPVANR